MNRVEITLIAVRNRELWFWLVVIGTLLHTLGSML